MPIYSEILKLKKKANWVRNRVLDMCIAGGGHLVSTFSCIEIMVALYYGGILRYRSDDPEWDERDRFILSKGHAATALYSILADVGCFPAEDLDSYHRDGSILGSHPDKIVPGVEVTTGSLGHGIGLAAGMALAGKMDRNPYMTFVLIGDGECSEGSVWEAALLASSKGLVNLVAIIDRNQLCATDFTEKCMRLDPLLEKWKAFGWEGSEIDGHSFEELLDSLKALRNRQSCKPYVLIADTVKGKGVSFMENQPLWHTKVPAGGEIELAKKELMWEKDEQI